MSKTTNSPFTSLHASSHMLNRLLFPENATISPLCLPFCCFITISLLYGQPSEWEVAPHCDCDLHSLMTNLNDLTLTCYVTTAYLIGYKLGWNELIRKSTQKDSIEASLCHWRILVPSQTKFSASSYGKGIHCLKRPWRFQYQPWLRTTRLGSRSHVGH